MLSFSFPFPPLKLVLQLDVAVIQFPSVVKPPAIVLLPAVLHIFTVVQLPSVGNQQITMTVLCFDQRLATD